VPYKMLLRRVVNRALRCTDFAGANEIPDVSIT
jgi:hypothetical protein